MDIYVTEALLLRSLQLNFSITMSGNNDSGT
jgi:hypothetical protein